MQDPIYLDHAATSPLRPEVREAMLPFLEGEPLNPSSAHRWGRRAAEALDGARRRVAGVLGVSAGEIRFVRGGTEADNLAVVGLVLAAIRRGTEPRAVVSAVEHRAVLDALETVRLLAGVGDVLPVDRRGAPLPEALDRALARRPAVLSLMRVNNETGIVHPVPDVAARCREAGVILHTDAVQAAPFLSLEPEALGASLVTLTAHKLGGPPGTGVLVVRDGVELEPLLRGGGQEGGLRPGTEDVAGAVGMAEALVRAVEARPTAGERLALLRDRLQEGLREALPGLRIHGEDAPRAPHILHVGIPGVLPDLLLPALDLEGVAASRGSACASGGTRSSHVLEALYGRDAAREVAPLRLSLGWNTTSAEVDEALERIVRVVSRLQGTALAPA